MIATGASKATGKAFHLAIASDRIKDETSSLLSRVMTEYIFHHLVDDNWDIDTGCPSLVDGPPGDGAVNNPNTSMIFRAI